MLKETSKSIDEMNPEDVIKNKSIEDIVSDLVASGQYDNNYSQQNEYLPILNEERENELNVAENKIDYKKAEANPEFILWPSDSDITLLRVKRAGLEFDRLGCHAWDEMNDVGIPGDGTHLAESPSMVNLVTLVESGKFYKSACNYDSHIDWNCFAGGEYLLALSSWDPTDCCVRDVFYTDSAASTSNSCETSTNIKRQPIISNLSAKVGKLFTSCFPRFGSRDCGDESDSSDG